MSVPCSPRVRHLLPLGHIRDPNPVNLENRFAPCRRQAAISGVAEKHARLIDNTKRDVPSLFGCNIRQLSAHITFILLSFTVAVISLKGTPPVVNAATSDRRLIGLPSAYTRRLSAVWGAFPPTHQR